MSTEEEPNAADIFASKIGVNDLHARIWALHYLLTSLLITLREKGAIKTGDLEVMLGASQATLTERFVRLETETPRLAEIFNEMKSKAESVLGIVQRDLKGS